ncbi:MAG TPA: SRPBCC family protein [Longimicrobium sp.]
MLAKIALGAIALLCVVIATRPAAFRVQRTATIAAPAEVVFAEIGDLHRWERWNPFEQGDPSMRKTFEGSPSGVGSAYHYVSDRTGEGRMTLTEIDPHRRVAVRAEFIKPFAATNQVEFTLRPAANGAVAVTWAMSGRNNFVGKAISLFVGMDRMVGGEFEKGLAQLKRVSEAEAQRNDSRRVAVAG